MIEVTDEMVDAVWLVKDNAGRGADCDDIRHEVAAVLAIVERSLRASIAADIQTALAADLADSDVTSGEAIWEQAGYRQGLAEAVEIARGEP